MTETESAVLVYVTYQSSDGGRVTPQIQLSALLEQYAVNYVYCGLCCAMEASVCVIHACDIEWLEWIEQTL